MTESKQDLSKIDWAKCEMPEWCGRKLHVRVTDAYVAIVATGTVGAVQVGDVSWRLSTGDVWAIDEAIGRPSFERLDQLRAICRQVDAFIAAELARLKLEDEFPMSAEQAREFLRTHPGEHRLAWVRIHDVRSNTVNQDSHWHRWSSARGAPEVASTFFGHWGFDGDFCSFRYRLLESRNVPEAKPDWMPRTKAPEGLAWEKSQAGDVYLLRGTSNPFVFVPGNKLARDAMAACVAAYDEKHADPVAAPDPLKDFGASYIKFSTKVYRTNWPQDGSFLFGSVGEGFTIDFYGDNFDTQQLTRVGDRCEVTIRVEHAEPVKIEPVDAWRDCTKEEALEKTVVSEWFPSGTSGDLKWWPMARPPIRHSPTFRYRTRAKWGTCDWRDVKPLMVRGAKVQYVHSVTKEWTPKECAYGIDGVPGVTYRVDLLTVPDDFAWPSKVPPGCIGFGNASAKR